MSPKVDHSARAKKSLSRIVLEHNTFAKTKQTDNMETESTEENTDSAIECTPMKTFKQIPSLMDVTLSPIVNKSVLQSSTDSTISESADKEAKSEKSTIESELKPLPAFTTLQETCIEKSVLHSYESSTAETSVSIREEKVVITEKGMSNVLKPLPVFTLNETEFDKSVLHSYESSVAEVSSIQEDKDATADKNLSKPFAAFVHMIQTDFEKSVLRSAESSIAETSTAVDESKIAQEASSLITNDSDVEMEEKTSQESKKTAAEQKEREKIVEIKRLIDEIQDMSDDDDDQDETESSEDDGAVEIAVSDTDSPETSEVSCRQ